VEARGRDGPQYVQSVVFGHLAAREFQNPRLLGSAVPAPELKPLVPAAASRSDYGYVNFECAVRGTPSYGRIYSINYDLQRWIWSTVGTFGWVAPQTRYRTDRAGRLRSGRGRRQAATAGLTFTHESAYGQPAAAADLHG
jgi:hypothetical protein